MIKKQTKCQIVIIFLFSFLFPITKPRVNHLVAANSEFSGNLEENS